MSDIPYVVMNITICTHDQLRIVEDATGETVIECMYCNQFWDADMFTSKSIREYRKRRDE